MNDQAQADTVDRLDIEQIIEAIPHRYPFLMIDRVIDLPGAHMRLEVKDGAIRVLSSDCPQQICVNGGWIRRPRQVIACVPNKTLVTIESAESPFLDAIVR